VVKRHAELPFLPAFANTIISTSDESKARNVSEHSRSLKLFGRKTSQANLNYRVGPPRLIVVFEHRQSSLGGSRPCHEKYLAPPMNELLLGRQLQAVSLGPTAHR